jgi:hypothetical protein
MQTVPKPLGADFKPPIVFPFSYSLTGRLAGATRFIDAFVYVFETSRSLVMLDEQGHHVSWMYLYIFLETSRSLVLLKKGENRGLSNSTPFLLYIFAIVATSSFSLPP